mmetsp:Transcript_55273/g.89391  ORF Transcript_55273/g.89391 Transcript_55273/m.89391 type:complete len:167 (-) Transcript_55273:63-563(-)
MSWKNRRLLNSKATPLKLNTSFKKCAPAAGMFKRTRAYTRANKASLLYQTAYGGPLKRSAEAHGSLPQECQEEEEDGQNRQHVDDGREDHELVGQSRVRCLWGEEHCQWGSSCERGQVLRHLGTTQGPLASASRGQEGALQRQEPQGQDGDRQQCTGSATESHGCA